MSTRENKQIDSTNNLQDDDHELVCNQNDIENLASKRSGIHKDTMKASFNAMWDAICEKLEEGYEVKLHAKGSFYLVKRSSRIGRNPLTGEEYDIPAREAMAFRTSPAYAKRLRKRREALHDKTKKEDHK